MSLACFEWATTLQRHHVYSMLKRRGNGRFQVISTRNTRNVFGGYPRWSRSAYANAIELFLCEYSNGELRKYKDRVDQYHSSGRPRNKKSKQKKKQQQKTKNKLKTKWPSVPLQTNTDVTETTAQYICYLRICSFVKHITTFLCAKVRVVLI